MIVLFIILLLLTAGALEFISLRRLPDRLRVRTWIDMTLSEPEEIVTLHYSISNLSFLPQLFIGFSVYFSDGIRLREDDQWLQKYTDRSAGGLSFSRRFFLLPHQKAEGKLHFSVASRGLHEIGTVYLESGDYLGIKSATRSFPISDRLICTAPMLPETPDVLTLGGLFGDYPVQRTLQEDPLLMIGYRDYTGREAMRQISWKQTARLSRLTVREQDHTLDKNAVILVDLSADTRENLENMLSLLRTVCSALEEERVPYAVYSNGDLSEIEEGLGRAHMHALERRIGLSRPVAYNSFELLAEKIARDAHAFRNFLVLAPSTDDSLDASLALLERVSASPVSVLYGKEAAS